MIVNIKSGRAYDIYIGRSNKYYNLPQSKWANPWVIGVDGTRAEVIEKYKSWILTKPELLKDINELKDKTLACWCDHPTEDCHGRILLELLKDMDKPANKLKVAIIGSREYTDRVSVFQWLDKNKDKISLLVSGGCPDGPDSMAQEWAKQRGFSILIHYPKWKNPDGSTNKGAGFQRNKLIANDADYVVAWRVNDSKGTTDTIECAKRLGKPVHVYDFVK